MAVKLEATVQRSGEVERSLYGDGSTYTNRKQTFTVTGSNGSGLSVIAEVTVVDEGDGPSVMDAIVSGTAQYTLTIEDA